MAYQTTFDVTGNREDLTDDIVNITPRETYLLSNMKRTKATGRFHEWQTDALASASVPNAIEGADSTSTTRTARTRLGNYCSTGRNLISVSDTQVEVRTAGTDNEFEYEVEMAMKEHARNWECGFIQSTSASGAAGTARTMSGFSEVITTNISSSGAERQYTYALHYAIAETISNAGGHPDILYYKSAVQADIATHPASAGGGASTAAPVVIQAPTGGVTDYYDWYHDSFGRKKLVRNDGNFAISTATASASVFHIEMGRCAFAVLRGTKTMPLAYLGGGPRAKVETEGCLQWGIQTAHGKVSNIAN